MTDRLQGDPSTSVRTPPDPRTSHGRGGLRVPLPRRFRWRRWVAGGTALLLLVAALSVIPALGARRLLIEARNAMESGREAILDGELSRARASFAEAESAFTRARSQTGNPFLRVMSFTPIVGRNPDAVRDIAEAGSLLARAGRTVSSAIDDLGGTSALAPVAGRIAIEPLASASGPLAEASRLVHSARKAFDRSPDDLLLGPVEEAHDLFGEALREAERAVHPFAAVAAALPEFLGAKGPRRYFFGAQDPAELRGTGGLIGAYSIMRVRDGAPRFTPFTTITRLRDRDARVEPPNPDYAARYGQFGAPNVWQNLNMTPDFPSAAVAIERLYREVTGGPVHGVIVADPEALAGLLEVTGPVRAPLTGDRLTSRNAVRYLTNEAFTRFPDSKTRKRLLGEAARVVFTRFLSGAARSSPEAAARALVSVAAGGHLLLHSADPDVQRDLERAGVGGSLPRRGHDFLAVIGNNAAGNKVDFWTRRRVTYTVRLAEGGQGTAEALVDLENEAPTTGYPEGVIGPYTDPGRRGEFVVGENVTFVSAYCAPGCGLERVERDGRRGAAASERELGHPVFTTTVRLRSGERGSLSFSWSLTDAWDGWSGKGAYDLVVRGQTTVRPTPLRIEVAVPDGMRVTEVSDGMRALGTRAVWEGESTDLLRLRVEFARSPLARMWRAVVDFLNRPLIRL